MQTIKCVVVGDGGVGKRELLVSYVTDKLPQEYVPLTVFENYVIDVTIGGEPYTLGLFDTEGQEDYDRLRPLSYPKTDVFIAVFSVVSPSSFENIKKRWVPELHEHCPKVPILLCGSEIELRDDAATIEKLSRFKQKPITVESGKKLAQELNLVKYMECSVLTQKGIRDIFNDAILAALGLLEESVPEPTKRFKFRMPNAIKKLFKTTKDKDAVADNVQGIDDAQLVSDDKSEELFEEAMQEGYVLLETVILLLTGVAGVGKSSFARLLFDQRPPKLRESTSLAQSAIRAVSVSQANMKGEESDIIWIPLSCDVLMSRIADGINYGYTFSYAESQVSFGASESISDVSLESQRNVNITDALKPCSNQSGMSNEIISREHDLSHMLKMGNFKDLLTGIKKSKQSKQVCEQKWLYLIDSGGQPQFRELLPTFVSHASAVAFVMKLNEELKAYPMIEYYQKGGKIIGKRYKSSLTNLEILQNSLQMMESRQGTVYASGRPKLFFIGTHRDLESKCKEKREAKNQQLLQVLSEHKKDLIYYNVAKKDELLYAVNTKKSNKSDYQTATDFRYAVMKHCPKQEAKIPIQWFVLEQILQQVSQEKGRNVLSFEYCLKLSMGLKMDRARLTAAIRYFCKLNIFKFFPTVLPNVVFTSSQVLLDKITELVELNHQLRGDKMNKNREDIQVQFRDLGKVSTQILEEYPKHYVEGLFEPKDLRKLLLHLLVMAEGPEDSCYMPCVLDDVPFIDLPAYIDTSIEPFLICFPGHWFPSGVFSSLISHLQNQSEWKFLVKEGKPALLAKNATKFNVSSLELNANISFIYFNRWIEVYVQFYGIQSPTQYQAALIRDTIFQGIFCALEIQGYCHLKPNVVFKCPCVQNVTKSSLVCEPHIATISPDRNLLCCTFNEEYHKILTDQQKLWLKESDHSRELGSKDHKIIYRKLSPYAFHWKDIGMELGFKENELKLIQSNPMLLIEEPPKSYLREMLNQWLLWGPGDSRGSESCANTELLNKAILNLNSLNPELASIIQDLSAELMIQ